MTKTIIITIAGLIFYTGLWAQTDLASRKVFIRVYDAGNIKINKGLISSITDTSIVLLIKKKEVTIDLSQIDRIKTRRSVGHNIGMGALAGAAAGGIFGFLQEEGGSTFGSNSRGDDALIYGTVGFMFGTVVGGLTALGKKSDNYIITGDSEKLSIFRDAVQKMPVKD
jgi:hypothetical protein